MVQGAALGSVAQLARRLFQMGNSGAEIEQEQPVQYIDPEQGSLDDNVRNLYAYYREQAQGDSNTLSAEENVVASEKSDGIINRKSVPKDKPYARSRPNYAKGQVEAVWELAKDPKTRKVYDPTGVEITWDRTKPRNGQWDMGHIPGQKYSEIFHLYMQGVISKEEFLAWYRDPNNYRPELPSTNRSHLYE